MCNLLLTIAEALDLPLQQFGDSTTALTGLSA